MDSLINWFWHGGISGWLETYGSPAALASQILGYGCESPYCKLLSFCPWEYATLKVSWLYPFFSFPGSPLACPTSPFFYSVVAIIFPSPSLGVAGEGGCGQIWWGENQSSSLFLHLSPLADVRLNQTISTQTTGGNSRNLSVGTQWPQPHSAGSCSRKRSDLRCQSLRLAVHLHGGTEDTAECAGVGWSRGTGREPSWFDEGLHLTGSSVCYVFASTESYNCLFSWVPQLHDGSLEKPPHWRIHWC